MSKPEYSCSIDLQHLNRWIKQTYIYLPLIIFSRVSCGTTWHAAGLLGKLRYTQLESKMSEYATQLYSQLEEETGLETG